jgi:alpha-tubulin suppressor-like RCC1 family protein
MRGRFSSFARATGSFVAFAIVCGGAACTSFGTETTPEVDGGSFRNDPSLGAEAFVAVTTGTSSCAFNDNDYCMGKKPASHTCALRNDGAVLCWGAAKSGRLGTVPSGDALKAPWSANPRPSVVPGLPAPATAIAAGADHTCALLSTKAVTCWGYNWNGQLGHSDGIEGQPNAGTGQPPGRLPLKNTGTVKDLVAGQGHTCVRFESGEVECTGKANDQETDAFKGRSFRKISLGWKTSCGVDTEGFLWCSGDSASNQITNIPNAPAFQVLGSIDDVTVGYGHICATPRGSGRPKCWGNCAGFGLAGPSPCSRVAGNPVELPGLGNGSTAPSVVEAGGAHTCWIEASNVYCFGASTSGETGAPPGLKGAPGDPILRNARDVSASASHTCAVTSAGDVFCWGNNDFGQLGASGPSTPTATKVVFPPG